jgi:hypothetical protein
VKTFLTILAAVVIAVSVTLLIQRQEHKPAAPTPDYQKLACEAGALNPECKSNSTQCGLDTNGHIVSDGKGGCILPPPSGYIIDAPKTDGPAVTFDMSTFIPICDRAVGASKSGKCLDNDNSLVDRSEYDRRPTHSGEPVPFCDKGANEYKLCWDRATKSIVNKDDYDKGR